MKQFACLLLLLLLGCGSNTETSALRPTALSGEWIYSNSAEDIHLSVTTLDNISYIGHIKLAINSNGVSVLEGDVDGKFGIENYMKNIVVSNTGTFDTFAEDIGTCNLSIPVPSAGSLEVDIKNLDSFHNLLFNSRYRLSRSQNQK